MRAQYLKSVLRSRFDWAPRSARVGRFAPILAGAPAAPLAGVCAPGMALILEVEVLYGPIGRNR
jgi:hypothetical protein